MTFDETDFAKRVPKKILDRTKENMEVYSMGLYDSFKEAVRELSKPGTKLWKACTMMILENTYHAFIFRNI